MMHEVYGAVAHVCNSAPLLDHCVHAAIIVFGKVVRRNKGIEDQHVYAALLDLFADGIRYRPDDTCALPQVLCDDAVLFPAAIDLKAVAYVFRAALEAVAIRIYTALHFRLVEGSVGIGCY